MKKLAVFASGSGSNFEAIVTAIQEGKIRGAEVVQLVCDKPQAHVLTRAERLGIPVLVLDPKSFPDKAAYEQRIVEKLGELHVDLIVLAGYMRLVGEVLLTSYEGKIINLHPSLLPSFPGKAAIAQALDYGVKVTGVTVHFVDAGMDTGPIIAQRSVPIVQGDTEQSLAARIHQEEHSLLVAVVQALVDERVQLHGRMVTVKEPI
ncbi:phosphoribosylglycinamide formyltransferase [Brevibacillus migulae]|uniref:phosphoribosylglycinamide formyltransferase n=1 Tax=Brevibacillus migulae TaxID=1644114 RepID=UPI00106E0579|nr:phosphoribosylglycinamide formyltransferase [Brevibacillus migulae]